MDISPPGALEHPAALAGDPIDWAGLRRVLAVRPDNVGDVLLLGPALRAMRAAAPAARLDLLASPAGSSAAALLPEVDGVLTRSPSWQQIRPDGRVDPAEEHDLVAALRAGRYDAAVVFTSFSQSPWPAAYACALAGIGVRAGTSAEFGGALLSHWVPAPPVGLHQVDRALTLLDRLGVPPAGTDLAVRVPAGAGAAAAGALGAAGLPADGPYAVLLPGASCSSRRYPADRFGEVARRLAGAGLPVAVVGTARERALVEAVADGGGPGVAALVGALDLAGLAALLGGAAVCLANNSGGMHLADAVRVPLVVTFAGTEDEDQYRPRSTAATLMRVPTACSPCRQFTCPFAHECLDLPAAEVAAAALRSARATVPAVG